MSIVDLLDSKFFTIGISFETYWQTNGKYHWHNKTNAWVDWIHDKWNSGLISIEEYRELLSVNVDEN